MTATLAAPKRTAVDPEIELIQEMGRLSGDPLKWVMFAFEWGKGELADHAGPDEWQKEILAKVRDGLSPLEAIRLAVASGHGVGKSALVAWLVLWAISTHEDTRGVCTANTEAQLRTKTWPELSKWFRLCIINRWFNLEATSISSKDPAHAKTWRVDAIPWSERNAEAFAGLHNQGRRILIVFDEASAIADSIWETTEGALTDANTEIMWFAFGNPTRNAGRFYECFGRFRDSWQTIQVDSRTARMSNKEQLAKWVQDYGEDSDFVRVRVRGVFPATSIQQMIPTEYVEAAMARQANPHACAGMAKILGVDPARFGVDKTTLWLRQGIAARKIGSRQGMDNVAVAGLVASVIATEKPDGVFIDEGGVGAGVVDILRSMGHVVIGVQFGGGASEADRFQNRRAEMWWSMREWLEHGAILPQDPTLKADLVAPEYTYTLQGRIKMESKDDLKDRGLASPDDGDAVALTFAAPVAAPRDPLLGHRSEMAKTEYDVLA
jgi:hypothetical protein